MNHDNYGFHPINLKSFLIIMPKDLNYRIYATIDGEDIPFDDSYFAGKSLDYFDDWSIYKVQINFCEWANPDGKECKGIVADLFLSQAITITSYPNPNYDLKGFEKHINRIKEDNTDGTQI